MTNFNELANEFLAQEHIAVVGVSRGGGMTANVIYKKLRQQGNHVYPINPNAESVEGDVCYPNVAALPNQVGGVVVVARPSVVEQVVKECVEAGIPRLWMHENGLMGKAASSVSDEAVAYGREHGMTIIAGGCPMMFMEFGHKCMRWMLGAMGRLPQG